MEFETVEEALEALVLVSYTAHCTLLTAHYTLHTAQVNNLRVEGVEGDAEGQEFDIKLCFSRTFN